MAGTRKNALVAAGDAAFIMCAFMVRDTSRSEAQIVSYVVSGVGFLGAGVIFQRQRHEHCCHDLVLGSDQRSTHGTDTGFQVQPYDKLLQCLILAA